MEIDALFLSNSVEVQKGLLYALGGGWTRTWPTPGTGYPVEKPLPVTTMIRVGWNDTNEEHSFEISCRDVDENSVATPVKGAFNVGKPPDLTRGVSQLVVLSGTQMVTLPAPGVYHLVLSLDGTEMKRIEFEALPERPAQS